MQVQFVKNRCLQCTSLVQTGQYPKSQSPQDNVNIVDVGGRIDNRVIVVGVSLDVEIGQCCVEWLPNRMRPMFGDVSCPADMVNLCASSVSGQKRLNLRTHVGSKPVSS